MTLEQLSRDVCRSVLAHYLSPVHAMDLSLTMDCNLGCDYCFARGGDCTGLYMSETLAMEFVDNLFRESLNSSSLYIIFFGGEPLLALDTLKVVVAYARDLGRYYNKRVNFSITTNGVLLTRDTCMYLKENGINPMISLDGSRPAHDTHRRYPDGRSSFDDVIHSVELMREVFGWAGIRMTVSPDTVMRVHDDIVWLLNEFDVSSFTVCPNSHARWSAEDIDAYAAQLEKTVRLWVERTKSLRPFQLRDHTEVVRLIDMGPFGRPCGAGFSMVSAAPDGYLYPCSRLIGYEQFRIGTSKKGRIKEGLLRDLMLYQPKRDARCQTCEIVDHCTGGCVAINAFHTGDIRSQSVESCGLYKARMGVLLKGAERLALARGEPITGACNVCIL